MILYAASFRGAVQTLGEAWAGLRCSAFFPVSSSHTHSVISLACEQFLFISGVFVKDTASFTSVFNRNFQIYIFLSHFDGGSIVYVRRRGVCLIDVPFSQIACPQR